MFKEISEAARSGAETSIPGFGKFNVKETPAREGRNPSTGTTIRIETVIRAGEGGRMR